MLGINTGYGFTLSQLKRIKNKSETYYDSLDRLLVVLMQLDDTTYDCTVPGLKFTLTPLFSTDFDTRFLTNTNNSKLECFFASAIYDLMNDNYILNELTTKEKITLKQELQNSIKEALKYIATTDID